MKKILLSILLAFIYLTINAQSKNFVFKSDIEFLQSEYCDYSSGYANLRFLKPIMGTNTAYSKSVEIGLIDEGIASVFDTTNAQTKYYDKYKFAVDLAKGVLKASKKMPVLFRKMNSGKISMSVNFIELGNISEDVQDKELIEMFIDNNFKNFNLLRLMCNVDEEGKSKDVDRIGISFLYGCNNKIHGIALYINKNDIKQYEDGLLTKQQLIKKCTVYKKTDTFRLLQ